jgi:hypothetical protein
LSLGLNFVARKNFFLQKIVFKSSLLKAFAFALLFALAPLSPHLHLFNLTTIEIKLSSPWGKGEELTTKPSLFQTI